MNTLFRRGRGDDMPSRERIGRTPVIVSVIFTGVLGCKDNPPKALSKEPDAGVAVVGPRSESPSSPRETIVRAVDAAKIDAVDVALVDPPTFEVRQSGSPKALIQDKHLRLDPEGALTSNRGLVAVQLGPDYSSEVRELRLIDLETGDVLVTLADVYVGRYPSLGLAFGRADVNGTMLDVLLRAGDAKLVPLWPHGEQEQRLALVHPLTGEAWVFDRLAGGDLKTAIAPWPDLRAPPPRGTEVISGGLPTWDRSRPLGWYGARPSDPVDVPMLIEPAHAPDECPKVALEGSKHRCVGFNLFVFTNGWEMDSDASGEALLARSRDLGRAQRLELGEDCEVHAVSLAPPTATIRCNQGDGPSYLWTPDRTFAVPAAGGRWSRDGHIVQGEIFEDDEETQIGTYWVDTVRRREILYRPASLASPLGDFAIERDPPGSDQLFAVDFDSATIYPVPVDGRGCASLDLPATTFPWVAVGCYDAHERLRRLSVFDLAGHRIWRLPVLREMWLQPERSRVVGLIASQSGTRVVSWTLR